MSRYAVIIYDVDGRHVRGVFGTQAAARQALRLWLGHEPENPDAAYSDYGARVFVDTVPDTIRTKIQAQALFDAYDARETGTLTPSQARFLAQHGA